MKLLQASVHSPVVTFSALFFVLFIKIGCSVWLRSLAAVHPGTPPTTYSFVGSDYPRVWDIGQPREQVVMPVENSIRYQVDSEDAAAEWAALAPAKGIIHLGEHRRPFSISMFHQLRCLDILRKDIVQVQKTNSKLSDPVEAALAQHCLNYVRQMLFCGVDTTLDIIAGTPPKTPAVYPDRFKCQDWDAVYDAVRRNQNSAL